MINVSTTTQCGLHGFELNPAGRSLHLVDVENLLGSTRYGEVDVAATADAYGAIAGLGPTDLVVVASSHFTALPTWFGWRNARRLIRSGPDGADLALIDVIETENVAKRFARVVIASGDGIFAVPAAQLQAQGVAVTVIARPGSLSRQLGFAALDVRYLEVLPDLCSTIALRAA